MLSYILATIVGGGSVGLYIAAFFFPEIHRKHDFLWSSVGCFYALSLWIYAHQISGGILVGHMASISLIGWFAWQTMKLRRQTIPINQQTPLPTKNPVAKGSANIAKQRLASATEANVELPENEETEEAWIELTLTPPAPNSTTKPIGRPLQPPPPPPVPPIEDRG
jgi:type III secretion system FlhB-like substrate exporter